MKHIALSLALILVGTAAQAACFVEYKAKQDSPLRLHYGIAELPGECPSPQQAAQALAPRLAAGGWVLLNVVGVSEQTPSDKKRADAGAYYLRF